MIEPVKMTSGERVRVECTHENTTDKLVVDGFSSLEEMCAGAIYRYPAGTDSHSVCND